MSKKTSKKEKARRKQLKKAWLNKVKVEVDKNVITIGFRPEEKELFTGRGKIKVNKN